MSANPKLIFD